MRGETCINHCDRIDWRETSSHHCDRIDWRLCQKQPELSDSEKGDERACRLRGSRPSEVRDAMRWAASGMTSGERSQQVSDVAKREPADTKRAAAVAMS